MRIEEGEDPRVLIAQLQAHIEQGDLVSIQHTLAQLMADDQLYWIYEEMASLAARGQDDMLRVFLECGVPVTPPEEYYSFPLCAACSNSRPHTVKMLLDAGADPNFETTRLTDEMTSEYKNALIEATRNQNLEIVALLLQKGANPSIADHWGYHAIALAVKSENEDLLNLFHQYVPEAMEKAMKSAIIDAAGNNDQALLKRLLQDFPDPNIQDNAGMSALHWACRNGHSGMVHLLISLGADINLRTHGGWTPLMEAADEARVSIVHMLIEAGAKVNLATPNGDNALGYALKKRHDQVGSQATKYDSVISILRRAGATLPVKQHIPLAETQQQRKELQQSLSRTSESKSLRWFNQLRERVVHLMKQFWSD